MDALPAPTTFLAFGLVSLGMVCSPGPNMIYLVSRSIAQGRKAGMVSLLGVVAGFFGYLLLICVGLAAVFEVVPAAYAALKWAGAAYLLWLAWQAIRPGAAPLFAPRERPPDSPRRLDLYRARFEGSVPKVDVKNGTVTFRYSWHFGGLFESRSHPGEVTLNAAIPWEVEARGGAYKVEAELGGSELSSFVLKGGISELDLTLPGPSGVVPIRLSGGASKVSIRRPAGVEARLNVKSGAATLTFDEPSFDAVGGTVRLQSPGYDEATGRYEIEVSGGASELTVQ